MPNPQLEDAAKSPRLPRPWRSSIPRTLLALLPAFVALILDTLLGSIARPNIWFLFYPAVFLSSWLGGLRAAVAATAISEAWVLLFLVPPVGQLPGEPAQYFPAAVFAATGLLFGLFHDRLRKANRKTQELEALATSLVEQAPEGIFIADLHGRYTSVNGSGCRMLGYQRGEEIIGKTILDLIPGDRIAQLELERTQLLRGDQVVSEWVLRKRDGSWLPVEVNAKILPDGRWQGFVRDISERKRLEAALRESHDELLRAQIVASVGSWRLDVQRNMLHWSDEEYRIFDVEPGTPMTYEAFLDCVHPDDRAHVDREWSAALRGQPYDIEHRIIAAGEVRWVREKADLERDANQKLVGAIGVTLDITDRKQREEELRRAQERLELALRGADLALWDWDIASGEVVFNPRWAEMRGYRLDEIRGHVDTWSSGVHPEDWPRVEHALQEHFQGRNPEYVTEHRIRAKSGQWIWILDRGKVVARNQQGEPVRMAGTELDITAQKQAEEALRLAEAKSRGIVSIALDAIISIDREQRITLFNEGAEKIFGHAAAEVVGEPIEMLIPERFRAAHRQHVERFAAGDEIARRMGQRSGSGIVGVRKNGEEFPAQAAISRLQVGGERTLTVVLRDVTEEVRVGREQRFLAELGSVLASTLEAEETLVNVANTMVRELADVCIVEVAEPDGRSSRPPWVAHRDPALHAACEALRQAAPDPARARLGAAVLDTRRPLLLPEVSPEDLESIAASEPQRRALCELGVRSLIVLPLLAPGRPVGTMLLVRTGEARRYTPDDLRLGEEVALRAALALENARLYQVSRRATQARDDVLGVVAHDLRNPLSTILMQAALMRRRGPAADRPESELPSRNPADAIERAAKRMNRLIQDLLDVTRMEAGRLFLARDRLGAGQVVADAVEAQRSLAESASIELRLELAPELPELWADRDRLLQVFENLIGNAVRHTPQGGRITVGATARASEVLLWVADTGTGIPTDALPHVFDRFWQGRATGHAGAGLGLSIVKGIVESHGGRVWAESAPGRGSTFAFTIPTAPPAGAWEAELERPHA